MSPIESQHAANVVGFVRGIAAVNSRSTIDTAIGASWRRCMNDYALDPVRALEPVVLEGAELEEYRGRHEQLIRVAAAEIDWLYDHIAMSGCALLLTDAAGIVLYEKTDPGILATFRRSGLRLGADWSELRQGTNGMGTCIAEDRPVIVHRAEHFRACHIALSCTAAPIHDPDGSLVAVLDASTLNARGTRETQRHVMALVLLSAKLIEKSLFLRHVQRLGVPRSGSRPEFLNPPSAAAPALSLEQLAGDDPRMLRLVRSARRVAASSVSIMIQGATGTGKELFAQALHAASGRSPFVALNCAAIPESLIESELFGYRPGAFTGARREGMKGTILQASGGTLFLDEIGDMPLGLQTRLLRVLEEREVVPLGTAKPVQVDLRVMCASHQNLRAMIARGRFREDLYYRLNGITLELPRLAERCDKVALIRKLAGEETCGEPSPVIEAAAFERLLTYEWPGNIRELRNVLRTAAAICDGGVVRLRDLPSEVLRPGAGSGADDDPLSPIETAERGAMVKAISDAAGNMARAAVLLQVSRSTLYRRCQRLRIPHRGLS